MFETTSEKDEPDVLLVTDPRGYNGHGCKQDDGTYLGYVMYMFRDTILWKSHNSLGAGMALQTAISEYLEECEEQNVEPEVPWKFSEGI